MIPSYYGVGVAGSYFQTFRVGYFPMSMLSTAASQFFYARASRLKNAAEVRVLIAKVHLLMFFILLPYCIVVSLWPVKVACKGCWRYQKCYRDWETNHTPKLRVSRK